MNYDKLAECHEFTVVNEYVPEVEAGCGAYEPEWQLEDRFIAILESQGYEYLKTLTQEADLVANLRRQMERLNGAALNGGTFTDGEWRRFYKEVLANERDGVVEKTRKFQEERRFDFAFDDGRHGNLMIVEALADKYGMDAGKTRTFLSNALAIGVLSTSGEDFNKILPPTSMFAGDGAIASYAAKTGAVAAGVAALFETYKGLLAERL